MGRLSKKEEAEIIRTYVEVVKISAEAGTDLIQILTVEGLWLALTIDMALVTGELSKKNDPVLFAQREAMVALCDSIDKLSGKGIPIIEDINPIALLNKIIKPLAKQLGDGHFTQDDYIAEALPIESRILLCLFVPGILRLIFAFLGANVSGSGSGGGGGLLSKLL